MNALDTALAQLRDLMQKVGAYDVEIRTRVDGRVWIEVIDNRGITAVRIEADLDPDSAIVSPNEAMRGAFGESGRTSWMNWLRSPRLNSAVVRVAVETRFSFSRFSDVRAVDVMGQYSLGKQESSLRA